MYDVKQNVDFFEAKQNVTDNVLILLKGNVVVNLNSNFICNKNNLMDIFSVDFFGESREIRKTFPLSS